MELYVLSKQDLSIQSICKMSDYEINLDEETNAKSNFTLIKNNGIEKDNFIVLNGLYRQFLFIIDEVNTEKDSNEVQVTALDISNIFDRKVIEKNIDTMQALSIEQFIANTISSNFVNSDDMILNINYIDITWHTNTQGTVPTNAEDGLYNFHTFLTNCRQYKNIFTEFKFENGRLKIDITNKVETTELIDTTLPEVTDYNKVYEEDVTAKVTVLVRENNSEYNLYLRTDKTTTTNKNDPNRASGKIEVISVDTADRAPEEALNVMKGNRYNHLVEFKIAKTSQLMDISKLTIGRSIRIKTEDDIYDSYISAITLTDENFVYFKSGNLRVTLIDKLKKTEGGIGNKLDKTGGTITGNLNVNQINGQQALEYEILDNTIPSLRIKNKYIDAAGVVLRAVGGGTATRTLRQAETFLDNRNTNENPSYYWNFGRGIIREFKLASTLGITNTVGSFLILETIIPWHDSSGGNIIQIAYDNKYTYKRYSSSTTWTSWKLISEISGTWTPTISTREGAVPTMTYSQRRGSYKRIGNMVFVSFFCRGKITALTGTNNYGVVYGLPFASKYTALADCAINTGAAYNINAGGNSEPLQLLINSSAIYIQRYNGANAVTLKTSGDTDFQIGGSGWYEID